MIQSFKPLASSSAGCCYLVTADDGNTILLDAGVPVSAIHLATDFKTFALRACLLTHCHGDHSKSAKLLCSGGVDVFASKETWEAIPFQHHRRRTATPHRPFDAGPFKVLPFPAVHDAPGTLGFVVGHGTDRGLYLTDSAYSPFTFEGLTHVWVECNHSQAIMRSRVWSGETDKDRYARTAGNHMSLERLLEMLAANDLSRVEQIVLLHLSDGNADEAQFTDEVRKATGRPVYVAGKRGGLSLARETA